MFPNTSPPCRFLQTVSKNLSLSLSANPSTKPYFRPLPLGFTCSSATWFSCLADGTPLNLLSPDFSSPSFFVALVFTLLCCLVAVRFKSNGGRSSPLNSGGGEMFERASTVVAAAAQTGASMMEQLVPEITTHALSYLDYPSLCRLSMTNSLMRSAANDDNAWKALYHKDFTLEQDNVRPVNGWKAYYAATRAIVNLNAEFFNIIRERSLPAMGRLWLNADYVKCFHASSEVFTGYNAVMASWELAFNWEHDPEFQVQDVSVRVLTDMAWVTMKAFVDLGADMDMEAGPFNITNVYEFHNGRWYMVHHHSSVSNGVGEQEIDIVL